jgi:hypothetical protein
MNAADAAFFRTTHTRLVSQERHAASCSALVNTLTHEDTHAAYTNLKAVVTVPEPQISNAGVFRGDVVFSLRNLVVTLPSRLVWPHMSAADRADAAAVVNALAHHEAGHVRIAEDDVARLNTQRPIVTSSAHVFYVTSRARGEAGLDVLRRDQTRYDTLVDHGRYQDRLKPPLGGVPTILRCRS